MMLEDQGGQAAPSWLIQRIAPTELDTVFRFTQVHGRVHDENAFSLGGVSGVSASWISALLISSGSSSGRASVGVGALSTSWISSASAS